MSKCTEKACPYLSEDGQVLCRYHRQFFAYDISMTDRSIDMAPQQRGSSFPSVTRDGLVVRERHRAPQNGAAYLLSVYHKVLGSSVLMKEITRCFNDAPESQLNDWKNNHWAALELFSFARWRNDGPICQICGCRDLHSYHVGTRKIWKCRLCRYENSILRMTVLTDSHLTLDKWASSIFTLSKDHERGVIREIQRQLDSSYRTAWRINHLLALTGEITGTALGFLGYVNNRFINELKEKLQIIIGPKDEHAATVGSTRKQRLVVER